LSNCYLLLDYNENTGTKHEHIAVLLSCAVVVLGGEVPMKECAPPVSQGVDGFLCEAGST